MIDNHRDHFYTFPPQTKALRLIVKGLEVYIVFYLKVM